MAAKPFLVRWLVPGLVLATGLLAGCAGGPVEAIPQGLSPGWYPAFVGAAWIPRPLDNEVVPAHPWLAPQGRNGMHADSACSGAYPWSGPLGRRPRVDSYRLAGFGGQAATVVFDSRGLLYGISGRVDGFRLFALDPASGQLLAWIAMPPRPSMAEFWRTLDLHVVLADTSGGAYFHLDAQDRPLIVGADRHARLYRLQAPGSANVAAGQAAGTWTWVVEADFDLAAGLAPGDPVTDCLPDCQGAWWFVTRQGGVGRLDPYSGQQHILYLPGEQIQNTLAVGPEGVFLVSDRAMYCFDSAADGQPRVLWRETYDRGSRAKPGSINQGSGTTPTLVGRDFVAICDNAEPCSRVLFFWRDPAHPGPRLAASQAVFTPGRSNTENSLIAVGNSVVVENNWFLTDILPWVPWPRTEPGLARVDIAPDGSACSLVWTSREMSPTTVPKLSLANGLVYCYTPLEPRPGQPAPWYLTALDFRTGQTVFRVLTGVGQGYNNNWAPVTLAPDGAAWVGTFNGLVRVQDTY